VALCRRATAKIQLLHVVIVFRFVRCSWFQGVDGLENGTAERHYCRGGQENDRYSTFTDPPDHQGTRVLVFLSNKKVVGHNVHLLTASSMVFCDIYLQYISTSQRATTFKFFSLVAAECALLSELHHSIYTLTCLLCWSQTAAVIPREGIRYVT
jgi:hypothetical protein